MTTLFALSSPKAAIVALLLALAALTALPAQAGPNTEAMAEAVPGTRYQPATNVHSP